jgi:hypothetical protein
MLYFPIIWTLSILSYVLFFILLRKAEKRHNVYIERYPGNKFPRLNSLKKNIKTSTEPHKAKDFRLALFCFHLSRILFITPIFIYIILIFFE